MALHAQDMWVVVSYFREQSPCKNLLRAKTICCEYIFKSSVERIIRHLYALKPLL